MADNLLLREDAQKVAKELISKFQMNSRLIRMHTITFCTATLAHLVEPPLANTFVKMLKKFLTTECVSIELISIFPYKNCGETRDNHDFLRFGQFGSAFVDY